MYDINICLVWIIWNLIFFVLFICLFLLRAKYHKLKYGTELNQGEMKMPSFESGMWRKKHEETCSASSSSSSSPSAFSFTPSSSSFSLLLFNCCGVMKDFSSELIFWRRPAGDDVFLLSASCRHQRLWGLCRSCQQSAHLETRKTTTPTVRTPTTF